MQAVVIRNGVVQGQRFVEVEAGGIRFSAPTTDEFLVGSRVEVSVIPVAVESEITPDEAELDAVVEPESETVEEAVSESEAAPPAEKKSTGKKTAKKGKK